MPTPINIEIGDVHVAVSSRYPLLLQKDNPSYDPFFSRSNKGRPDIRVAILPLGPDAPDLRTLTQIFDSGRSWEMFTDGDEYVIAFDSAGFRPMPFWLARANRDFSRVTVYCGEELTQVRDGVTAISNPVCYPLDQILLMYVLAPRGGALIHAAGVDIDGRGCIFPGPSGAGKSTTCQQFISRSDFCILSDDRVIVRNSGATFNVFGTPWPGDAGIARNAHVPLRGIFFMLPGQANRITAIDRREALERLMPVTSIPWYDREIVEKNLTFMENLVSNVPAYELRFKPSLEVADVVANFISS